MAFRRFKRSFTKKAPFRRALARKANHRYDRFLSTQISACEPLTFAPQGCPREGADNFGHRIILLDNSVLELQYSDSATVVAQKGRLYFTPFYAGPEGEAPSPDADVRFQEVLAASYHFMGGIRRIEQLVGNDLSGGSPPIANPLMRGDDYTDVPWIKFFERRRVNLEHMSQCIKRRIPGTPFGVCADTVAAAAGAPENTLTDGSGTVTIPAISTTCTIMNFPGTVDDTPLIVEDELCITEQFKGFTLNFASRKRTKLTGKHALVFDFDWLPVALGVIPPDVGFAVHGLIQSTIRI